MFTTSIRLSVFFLLLFLSFSLAQNNTLVYQCMQFPPLNNNLCFSVKSNDCLQITGSVTWNSVNIVSPQRIPLDRILSLYQRQLRDPEYADGSKKFTMCQPLQIPGGTCNACNTISDLRINGDNLHYCGSLTVNCTILGMKYERTLVLPNPCVDLRDCKTYGCQNNCSSVGRCTSVGLCQCPPGHFGFDCSTQIVNDCISSPTIPKSCWKFDFPDCNTVVYKVTTPAGEVTQRAKLDSGSTLNLVPCQKFNNVGNNMNCEMCVDAKNLQKDDNRLTGCPSLVISCSGQVVANTPLDCIQLAQSPALVCPNTDGTPIDKGVNGTDSLMGNQSPAKTILIAMAAILGLVLLGTGGYLVATKVIGFDNAFQRVETYLAEDAEPLNGENSNIQEGESVEMNKDLEEDSV